MKCAQSVLLYEIESGDLLPFQTGAGREVEEEEEADEEAEVNMNTKALHGVSKRLDLVCVEQARDVVVVPKCIRPSSPANETTGKPQSNI